MAVAKGGSILRLILFENKVSLVDKASLYLYKKHLQNKI
jgi:hypothetical protein